jgi:hypothetical protein
VLDDSDLIVATTEVAIDEMHDHAEELADLYKLDLDTLHAAIEVLPVDRYSETDYVSQIKQAGVLIEHRDPDDGHIVALALKLGVPIWSNDNDFRDLSVDRFRVWRQIVVTAGAGVIPIDVRLSHEGTRKTATSGEFVVAHRGVELHAPAGVNRTKHIKCVAASAKPR